MKLRIKGNSLRLRVSRSELALFQAGGRIEETIHFTAAPEANLTYALESALQASPVTVRYGSREVTVILSRDRARIWEAPSEVGVYTTLDIGSAGSSRSSSRRTSPVLIGATRIRATPSPIPMRERPADRRCNSFQSSTVVLQLIEDGSNAGNRGDRISGPSAKARPTLRLPTA